MGYVLEDSERNSYPQGGKWTRRLYQALRQGAYELWTYSLLQERVREHCRDSLAELSQSRLHRILTQGEIRPHKIRYYVERRDPEFEAGMALVLHVHIEVEILTEELIKGMLKEPPVVTISYDEKPAFRRWRRPCRSAAGATEVPEPVFGTTGTSDWERYRC